MGSGFTIDACDSLKGKKGRGDRKRIRSLFTRIVSGNRASFADYSVASIYVSVNLREREREKKGEKKEASSTSVIIHSITVQNDGGSGARRVDATGRIADLI